MLPPEDTTDENIRDKFLDSAVAAVDNGQLTDDDPKVVCSNILVVLSLLNGLNATGDESNPSTGTNTDTVSLYCRTPVHRFLFIDISLLNMRYFI